MARRRNFKDELERRRAIAAALLLEEPSSAVIKTAKGFVDGLAPGYRRALADFIGWLDDDEFGTEPHSASARWIIAPSASRST